ncbi:MAG TPA: MarR family transcriptional regulator [Ramlibacter sp.]|nr:MarR family transcriptional regulator [Ramlibacter sp.]
MEKLLSDASNTAPHDLEKALPYLLARAGMRMGQAFSRELKAFELSLGEWRILAALLQKPHQRLAELAEHTSAEPSTLSRTVDGLVTRELLIRERAGDDARALALRLSAPGEDLARRIVPLAQLYERVALSGISAAQVETLKDMLRRIYANMDNLDAVR